MSYYWVANMHCSIRNGSAFICDKDRPVKGCNGNCTACSKFLGVDITQVGKEELDGCCSALQSRGENANRYARI